MFSLVSDNVFLAIFGSIMLVISVVLMQVHRTVPGIKELTLSATLNTLGVVLFLADVNESLFWPKIVVANLCFIFSGLSQLFGFADLFKRPIRRNVYILLTTIAIITFLAFVVIKPSFEARLLTINLFLAVLYVRALIIYLSTIEKWGRISQVFIIPAISLLIVIFLTRILHGSGIAPQVLVDFSNQLLTDDALLIVILLIVSYYILAAEYQANQLKLISNILENRVKLKTNMIRFLNHELKTPLNAVLLKLEMLRDSTTDETFHRDIDFLKDINISILETTHAFLDHGVFEEDTGIVSTDLKGLIQETLRVPKLLAQKKGLDLTLETRGIIPRRLLMNQNALQIIILNLITNAIKYTQAGHVKLTISCRSALENHADSGKVELAICVEDTGIGMAESELDCVFDPFWRSKKVDDSEGTGLGLPIVKELLATLDSQLELASKVGVGTRASFSLKAIMIE